MAKKNKFYYRNIFLYSSLQFTGNFEEYFAMHTRKLVAFVLMPRQQPNSSLIRVYKMGKLVEEKKVVMSSNIFAYYFLWFIYQFKFLVHYFLRKEKIILITFHPISFFGMRIQKMIRNINHVYWVADYFPPVNISLRLFEMLKRFYNSKVKYACYLSDSINMKMNGKVVRLNNRKTVMWGVLPKDIKRNYMKNNFSILFVGVIKESQGLELVFEFLKEHKDYAIKIIGICDQKLFAQYKKIIKRNKIDKQVYFPNRFFSDAELDEISKKCRVGIAVYNIDETSATYYTDPGKIKAYAQLGLPIIMSNVSAIAPYIEKFGCGRVIKENKEELKDALLEIKSNYAKYLTGIKEFNKHFYYDTYYRKAFRFLEEI